MVPPPVPDTVTDRESLVAKVAVTELFCFMSIAQLPVPAQLPLHPLKMELALGVAVSLTSVLGPKLLRQDEPQLIPAGELVMEPLPETVTVSVKLCDCGCGCG
jgi:hypothetical protein